MMVERRRREAPVLVQCRGDLGEAFWFNTATMNEDSLEFRGRQDGCGHQVRDTIEVDVEGAIVV